jgi:hypothetical protein
MTTDQIITVVASLGLGSIITKIVSHVFERQRQRRGEDVSITLSEREELREIHRLREEELREVRKHLDTLREVTIEKYRQLELENIKLEFGCREKEKRIEELKLDAKELETQIEILKAELSKREKAP